MNLRKAIHQFFLHVANLFYEEEKEVLVMGELTKKLRYQKTNGVTGAITLYSTAAEAGDNHLNLQVDNVNAYAALGEVSDANASHLRIQKGNTTYAVLTEKPSGKVTHITETFHWEYDDEATEREEYEIDVYYLESEHFVLASNYYPWVLDEGMLEAIAEPYKTLICKETPDIRVVIPELGYDTTYTYVGGGFSYYNKDEEYLNIAMTPNKTYNVDLYFLYGEE